MSIENVITKSDYPIRWRWSLSTFVPLLPIALFVAFGVLLFAKFGVFDDLSTKPINETITMLIKVFFIYYSFFILLSFLFFISKFLIMINFHYELRNEFLVARQGVFSKEERHTPYGIIQNISINQNLFDRLLGTASLKIETAAESAGWDPYGRTESGLIVKSSPRIPPEIGFRYHFLVIPGIAKRDAESLKEIILQKMKKFPIKEAASGL